MTQIDRLEALFRETPPETDVPIVTMYEVVYEQPCPVPLYRGQRRVGALISRLHRRFEKKGFGWRIKPGQLKQTYRLTRSLF